jgi:soluble lytic murein transglycosylase-like protein
VNRLLPITSLLAIAALAFFFYREINVIKAGQVYGQTSQIETQQFLLSTINWSTQRQKTLLFMRDQIIKEWLRVGDKNPNYTRAFEKAEFIIQECEKYPGVQPLFMLAVQNVESSFYDSLVSVAGAIGEWQIMPGTARLLCAALGIEFNKKVFYDPICTKLAGKYFDILSATYQKEEEMLADYNGGPYQAFYYRTDKTRLDSQTARFVIDVMARKNIFMKMFETYRVDAFMIPDTVLIDSLKTKKVRIACRK